MNRTVLIILLTIGSRVSRSQDQVSRSQDQVSRSQDQVSRSQDQVSRSDGQTSTIEGEDRLKCGEKEFQETRNNYENCASEKIVSVTRWLQKVTAGEQGEQEVVISEVCSHVQDLLHSCGDELGWCFTADQVEETKNVQKSGIRDILRRHLPEEKVESCLENSTNTGKGGEITEKIRPEPRSLLIEENKFNTTQNVSEVDVDDAYDISDDDKGTSANTRESKQISSSNASAEVTTLSYTEDSTLVYTQQPSASSSSSLNRAATYPTECDPPTCGCKRYSSYSFQIIILATLLSVFRKTT